MKKLKFLLFIILLFFIFIGNSKAYDITTINDVVINENYIVSNILSLHPDFDISSTPYQYCFSRKNEQDPLVYCYFLTSKYTFGYNSENKIIKSGELSFFVNSSLTPNIKLYTSDSYINWFGYKDYYIFTNFDSGSTSSSVYNSVLDFDSAFNPPEEPEPQEPIIENKIYLPIELEEGKCPYILNKDVIRVYDTTPVIDTPVNYTDYFINSHYISQNGTETLSNTINCLDLENFTNAYVYRFDFSQIIVIFVSIVIIIGYPLLKIIHAFFIGFKKR